MLWRTTAGVEIDSWTAERSTAIGSPPSGMCTEGEEEEEEDEDTAAGRGEAGSETGGNGAEEGSSS